jgi:phosphate/sulfate permease
MLLLYPLIGFGCTYVHIELYRTRIIKHKAVAIRKSTLLEKQAKKSRSRLYRKSTSSAFGMSFKKLTVSDLKEQAD